MPRKYLLCSLIIAIFLIALILRTFNLTNIPNGLHVDELDAGYIGRYILEHGKDITEKILPLYYNKFGDYRPTGVFYLSGLSVKLFGPTITAIRLPGAIMGSLTTIAIIGLSYALFGNILAALATGLFLAITPWHIILSRATSEGIAGLFFLVTGFAVIIFGLTKSNNRLIILGSLVASVSYLFYHPFRLLTPVFLLPFLIFPNIKKQIKKSVAKMLLIFFMLTFLVSVTSAGSSRFGQVAFFANPLLNHKVEDMLATEGSGNVLRARIFHNKPVIIFREFIFQYFKYFSPEFLFLSGGLPDRYRVPEQGLLYILFFPLIILGCFYCVRDKKMWPLLFNGYLLLTTPLAAALTYEDTPNTHRSLIMVVPLVLLAGYGFSSLSQQLKRNYLKFGLITITSIILIMETSYFWHQYTIHAAAPQSFYRNDRFFELARFLAKSDFPYDAVYVTGYEHLPLYFLFSINNFESQPFNQSSNDVLLDKFNKINFVHAWCPNRTVDDNKIPKNILLIERGDCEENYRYHELSAWKRKDATTVFKMMVPKINP